MSENKQKALIPASDLPPTTDETRLSAERSIRAAMGVFENHMRDKGFSIHTIKAFSSDLRLMGEFMGSGQPIGNIGTKDLNDFLYWQEHKRGKPCSAKTYARRVTTLKVFFKWLVASGVLTVNPATAVPQRSVKSPLPTLPTRADIAFARVAAQQMRKGELGKKADSRPYLLLSLLLKTGIKKSEAMAIVPNHIDYGDEMTDSDPFVFIRYKSPRMRYKERKITLDAEWLDILDEYLRQYAPTSTLFTCTARNLEYVLRDIGAAANLKAGLLSFENLRWASALEDYRTGVEHDAIRQRLGLSKITWRETKRKLNKLREKESPGSTTAS